MTRTIAPFGHNAGDGSGSQCMGVPGELRQNSRENPVRGFKDVVDRMAQPSGDIFADLQLAPEHGDIRRALHEHADRGIATAGIVGKLDVRIAQDIGVFPLLHQTFEVSTVDTQYTRGGHSGRLIRG